MQTREEETKQYHVLVVDDNAPFTDLLEVSLVPAGYKVRVTFDGATALAIFPKLRPDLVILDLIMPGLDGFAVLAGIRRTSDVPVLVLSAKQRTQDKVRALDEGADDYLAKPFEMEELLARVNALLRRTESGAPDGDAPVRSFGNLCIDSRKRSVTLRGDRLHLTPTEYALLLEFATHPDEVLHHSTLLQRVWGPGYQRETQYLHVYVQRLRSKIEDDPADPRYIVTETGVGYRFFPDASGV